MKKNNDRIIVLHGLGLSPFWLWPLSVSLRRAGYTVQNLGYPSREKNIADLAREHLLPVAINEAAQTERLHFVGHSLGGLLIRSLAADCGFLPTGRVVMLGTPNQGSEVADYLKRFSLYRRYFGPAGQELGTATSDKPKSLPPVPFDLGVMAGTNHWLHFPTGVFMSRPNDGIVSLESTRVAGMKDHISYSIDHSLMVLDPRVMYQTRHFLENGCFNRKEA